MPEVEIKDGAGSSMVLLDVDGRLYPKFSEEVFRSIPSFKFRPDDVVLSAYPKSGTHWVWEMIRFLQAGSTDLEVVEKTHSFMEQHPQEHFEKLPSPRSLNTHVRLARLPLKETTKVIVLNRNPKDVAVSLYNHVKAGQFFYKYDGVWSEFLKLFLSGKVENGSWFEYIKESEEATKSIPSENLLKLMYEDLIKDPMTGIKQISDFLGKTYSDDFLAEVRDKCSFDHMKKQKGNIMTDSDGKPIFYRKGKIGDWKNWFTVAQNEQFDQLYQEQMKNSQLTFTYT